MKGGRSTIQKIWHDPVFSNVIAAVIFAVLMLIASGIAAWWSSKSIVDAFIGIVTYPIPLWVVVVLGILWYIIRRIAQSRHRTVSFLTFTQGVYQNQTWTWTWGYKKSTQKYHIEDLSLICPNCHRGVLSMSVSTYHCGACGASIEWRWLRTDGAAVQKQIVQDVRTQYPKDADMVERNGKE